MPSGHTGRSAPAGAHGSGATRDSPPFGLKGLLSYHRSQSLPTRLLVPVTTKANRFSIAGRSDRRGTLYFPLSDFRLTTHPEHTPKVEEFVWPESADQYWFLKDLYPERDYGTAVTIESAPLTRKTDSWNVLLGPLADEKDVHLRAGWLRAVQIPQRRP